MSFILEIKDLSKAYDSNTALKDISLKINKGEKVALLGCNGAGKSTLLNIITGLKTQTSGTVEINGLPPGSLKTKESLSFLPQDLNFPAFLKVKDVLRLSINHFKTKLNNELLEKLDLAKLLNRYCYALSGGEERKLGIVLSLMGHRNLLILDEPTANVDLLAKEEIHKALLHSVEDKALVFSSHEMAEVEKLADRVIVLNKGVVVASGSVAKIKKDFSAMRVCFESDLKDLKLSSALKIEKKNQHFTVFGEESDLVVKELVSKGIDFKNLRIEESGLEEVFLKLWSDR